MACLGCLTWLRAVYVSHALKLITSMSCLSIYRLCQCFPFSYWWLKTQTFPQTPSSSLQALVQRSNVDKKGERVVHPSWFFEGCSESTWERMWDICLSKSAFFCLTWWFPVPSICLSVTSFHCLQLNHIYIPQRIKNKNLFFCLWASRLGLSWIMQQ